MSSQVKQDSLFRPQVFKRFYRKTVLEPRALCPTLGVDTRIKGNPTRKSRLRVDPVDRSSFTMQKPIRGWERT